MKIVKEIYHYLQRFFAKCYFKLYSNVEVIGIAGSVGKTTTKEMIAAVLKQEYNTLASFANIDPIYNIPLTVFKLRPKVEKMVIELSVDRFGDMDRYFRMIKPKVGVFTPIYWTHTEFLKNLEGVIKEKGKLAEILPKKGVLILNKDDKNSLEIAKKTKAKILYYGFEKEADIYAENIRDTSLDGVSFTVSERDKKLGEIKLNLLGRQNVCCALAAILTGKVFKVDFKKIKKGLEKVKPQPARMNVIKLPNGGYLIDDSYNSSPLAVKAALESVARLNLKGKKIAVLGEMKELGDYSKEGHKQIGRYLGQSKFDVLIVFGKMTKFTAREAEKRRIEIYEAGLMTEIIEILKKIVKKDDVVLLKGSRFAHMERITLGLLGEKIECNKMTCKEYIKCQDCKDLT